MIDLTKKYRFRNVPGSEIMAIVERNGLLGVLYVQNGTIKSIWLNKNGKSRLTCDVTFDLVEISPCDGWEVDKKIIVTNEEDEGGSPIWGKRDFKRHFCRVDDGGRVWVFDAGQTSFSSDGKAEQASMWLHAKPAEDLNEGEKQ